MNSIGYNFLGMFRLGDRTYARRMVGERDVPWRAATKVRSPVRTSACDMEEEDRARWMAARRFGLLVSLLDAMHYFVTQACMHVCMVKYGSGCARSDRLLRGSRRRCPMPGRQM